MEIQDCTFVVMPDGNVQMCLNIKYAYAHANGMNAEGFIFNRMRAAVILPEQVIIRVTN